MNKLTSINTITKAAPLALLAVVMSGSAFAGNNGQNNGSDKGRKGEPQGSLDVVVTCSLCDPNAYGYDPANYVNCDFDKSNPTMYLSAEIKDETGDFEPDETVIVPTVDVDVFGLRRDGGGPDAWSPMGGPAETAEDVDPGTLAFTLQPCELDETISDHPGGAKAISALVNVTITNLDASKETYSGRCENIIVNNILDDGIDDEDFVDQSNFDVKELGISCDVPVQQ